MGSCSEKVVPCGKGKAASKLKILQTAQSSRDQSTFSLWSMGKGSCGVVKILDPSHGRIDDLRWMHV